MNSNVTLLRSSQRKTDSQTKKKIPIDVSIVSSKQNHMCPKEAVLQRCILSESPITDSTAQHTPRSHKTNTGRAWTERRGFWCFIDVTELSSHTSEL